MPKINYRARQLKFYLPLLVMATFGTTFGLPQLAVMAQNRRISDSFDTSPPVMTQDYKSLKLKAYNDALQGKLLRGTASFNQESIVRKTERNQSSGNQFYYNTVVSIDQTFINNQQLQLIGRIEVSVEPNSGSFRIKDGLFFDFRTTLEIDGRGSIVSKTEAPPGFENVRISFDEYTNRLLFSWEVPQYKQSWSATVADNVDDCPAETADKTNGLQPAAYYLPLLDCLLRLNTQGVGNNSASFYAAIFTHSLLQNVSKREIEVSDVAKALNRYPKALSGLILSYENTILGSCKNNSCSIFYGGDYSVSGNDSEVVRLWPLLKSQLKPVNDTRQQPCATEFAPIYDLARFHFLEACKAFRKNDIKEVAKNISASFDAADLADWEINLAADFAIPLTHERIDVFTEEIAQILTSMIPAASKEEWTVAIEPSKLSSRQRYLWIKALSKAQQRAQQYPSRVSQGFQIPDILQTAQASDTQPFVCAWYDELQYANDVSTTGYKLIDFFSTSASEAANTLVGLFAGNLSDCSQTKHLSISEIANNSKAIITVLIRDKAAEEATEAALKRVCLKDKPSSARGGGKIGIASYLKQWAFKNTCRQFLADESGSTSFHRGRQINPRLPQGISRRSMSNESLSRTAPITGKASADDINNTIKEFTGADYPPFIPGTEINVHTIKEPSLFVRFYGGDHPNASKAKGNFMMPLEEIQGKSLAQIREEFAIPTDLNSMENMVIVTVRPGASVVSGPAHGREGWGKGGGNQYYLNGGFDNGTLGSPVRIEDWYSAQ